MAEKTVSLVKSVLRLNRILLLEKRDFAAACVFALLAGLVQLSLPLGIQSIISFVLAGTISTSIVVLIAMVVFGVFINGLLQVRQLQIIEKVKQKLFVRYSLEYSDRIPKLNIENLDHEYLPEVVNRYFDSVSLQKGIDKLMIELPASVIQVILGVVLLSFYHPLFIAFGIVLIGIVLTIIRLTSTKGLQTAYKASDYKYAVAAWVQEIARTIKSFKYTKGTSLHMNKTDALVSDYLSSRTSYFGILLTQFWSLISFKIIITAAMLIIGAYLLVDQQINVGQFIAADIVIIAIIASIEKLIVNLDTVYDAIVSVEKLSAITNAETEQSGSLQLPVEQEGVSVEFKQVGFAYGNNKPVLKDINFSIKAGQMVQIKGVSGSGKSTVLRLLTGAFKNYTGHVLLNSAPVANYDVANLRRNTGILLGSQDIFQGTLWENLTMGNDAITMQQVNELCERTGLINFVKSSGKGYDTQLLPVGNKLSENVRRNILLVRALLAEHKLLLLEEPFAHLPNENKAKMIAYIRKEAASTTLIASQDETLSQYCDQLIQLSPEGEVLS
ncbi:ABC transporter ATP-binding protein/permease [Terrimonas sp. NA20]|uniref:ABC transporter ATP-binding protein/permease n=1 Tax=Terrimonas ginsenosidimutans TaxID=2908004 RepID=A0ABS9KVC4_9BACT|nr:ABC transporter ATP-binding protein [Terrimonas ginsenosidimutans]MCG2616260.1 ABC transporter ATP-binding protein/permease [Terrimonas ginsenosidimutans]